MNHDRLVKLIDFVVEHAVQYGFQVIGAIVILIVGWILSKILARMARRALHEKKIDITIENFIVMLVRWIVLGMALLFALGNLGVQIAPLIAGLSVAGVGIGLALQGPLSNYASGVTLIFTKPFKVGDIIDVKGYQGEVLDIALPRTELLGLDGSRIIIPNKHIIGEVIKNFNEYRKLEFNVGIAYDADVDRAFKIIEDILKDHPLVPNEQLIKVGILSFGDSSVNLQALVWVLQSNYLQVRFDVNKAILKQFKAHKIEIPFPQRDVHIYQKDAKS